MALWLAQVAAQAARALPDTIVTVQAGGGQSLFQKITGVASGLMTIALLVLTVALVPAAWNFRKSYAKVNELLEKIYGDINPIMRHASSITDNINYLTTAIKVDFQEVQKTIVAANARLNDAVLAAERRVRDLNALIDVVQHEAEETVIATASTLRGVRAGADALRAELAERPLLAGPDDPGNSLLDTGDPTDGNDSPAETEPRAERPRARHHARPQRGL